MKASSLLKRSSAGKKNLPASGSRLGLFLAWTALGLLVTIGLPLFLRMGVYPDVAYYGLFAQTILRGGVLERDIMVYFRPPTMGLLLAGLHVLFGWNISSIRLLDLAFVTGSIWLLTRWLRFLGTSRAAQVWTAFALLAFYFATDEWCHCQPDVWMLLPALGALCLRARQVARLVQPTISPGRIVGFAILEGICWGAACLFKPFVVVPGVLCWLLAVVEVRWEAPRVAGRLAADALGLLAGGLFVGSLWMGWLWWGGGWPFFWDDLRGWSSGYFDDSPTLRARLGFLIRQFWPWGLVHLLALPLAAAAVFDVLVNQSRRGSVGNQARSFRHGLLGCLYLGWFVQANFIQQQFDYQLAPTLFLALTVVAGQPVRSLRVNHGRWLVVRSSLGTFSLPALLAWLIVLTVAGYLARSHPLCDTSRLALWPRCWRPGSSAELRDLLTLIGANKNGQSSEEGGPISWMDLDQVAGFLRSQRIDPGQLTCYGMNTTFLYLDLDLPPSTRFPYLSMGLQMFPSHEEAFRAALNASDQRFVVSDLREINVRDENFWATAAARAGWRHFTLATLPAFPSQLARVFPWSEPVVFGSGPYLVHRVTGPVRKLAPESR